VVNHPNKWLRKVFRHYIQYLYFRRRTSHGAFGWIMEVVLSELQIEVTYGHVGALIEAELMRIVLDDM